MTEKNVFKDAEAKHGLLVEFWKNLPKKQVIEIDGEKISYVVISKEEIPVPEERKTFLGIVTRRFPGDVFNRELMVFIEDIVPKDFVRYIIIHEIEEGQKMGQRPGEFNPHSAALYEQLRIAKKELSEKRFNEFVSWFLKYVDEESKLVINSFFEMHKAFKDIGIKRRNKK